MNKIYFKSKKVKINIIYFYKILNIDNYKSVKIQVCTLINHNFSNSN